MFGLHRQQQKCDVAVGCWGEKRKAHGVSIKNQIQLKWQTELRVGVILYRLCQDPALQYKWAGLRFFKSLYNWCSQSGDLKEICGVTVLF